MCFGALTTTCEPCEVCGRRHPAGLDERCRELAAADAAARLDEELDAYLATPEARFFAWLAAR